MTYSELKSIAFRHQAIKNSSGADYCLAMAYSFEKNGDVDAARKWVVESLARSIGKMHNDYKRATA